jgi:ADP-ribose pyrophosphatase YjhB (NUDIX family)
VSTAGPSYVEGLRARIGTECIFVPGVRAIIVDEEDRVLLQRRSDFDCWGLPAGGVELNETVEQALCREVAEETGLTVEAMEPMALHSGPSQRFRYPNGDEVQGFAISFIVRVWTGRPKADGVEGIELRFFPIDALPEAIVPIHAETLQIFRNYRGGFIVC